MKKTGYSCFFALLLCLCSAAWVNAAETDFWPQSSDIGKPSVIVQPVAPQPSPQPAPQAPPSPPVTPSAKEYSRFEQYVSTEVTITDIQLQIINRLGVAAFRYSKEGLPTDQVAVPVRIAKGISGIVDAGYLVGKPEALASVFKTLGILNPFYVSTDLTQFGYDLFSQTPSSFAPVDTVPVGPDYLLGPGDELRISVWGKVNNELSITIDRDGSVHIPMMGVMHLSGLTFNEARDYITREFSRYYIPSEVKVNIGMGRLRTIRVFVLGNVVQPGSYTISSLSTLINALFAAGGPTKEGSMRDVRLNRDGKTIAHFDMYDFLLSGDKTKDVRLLPEDVIFVPTVGPLVGIAGSVKIPAIYEMKGETKVTDLIKEAGGTDSIAYDYRLQLLRIEDRKEQTRVELNLSDIPKDPGKDFPVKDGDLVTIFPVPQVVEDTVRISGAVKSPGVFGLKPGMKVSELIKFAGGLLRYADRENAELTRLSITPAGPRIERLSINLQKAEAGDPGNDIALSGDDYLLVRNVPEWERSRIVGITGEVRFPGEYIIKKGETLSSLIERAGGFTDRAYLKGAEFTRGSVRESQQKVLDDMVDRLEQQLLSSSAEQIQASITPETALAERTAAEQKKALIAKMKTLKARGRISIKLAQLSEFKGGPYDIPLDSGDTLTIPEVPHHIQVLGSVYNQTAFVYLPDVQVKGYVAKAGGTTKDADESSMYILKVDGTAVSRRESGSFFSVNYDPESHSWSNGGFMSKRLDPGDTIVVPLETEKVYWLREVKDITQILFQVALATGVVLALH